MPRSVTHPAEAPGQANPLSPPMADKTLLASLATASVGVAVIDRTGHIVDANPAFSAFIVSPAAVDYDGKVAVATVEQLLPAVAEALSVLLTHDGPTSVPVEVPRYGTLMLHLAAQDGATRLVLLYDKPGSASGETPSEPATHDPLTGLGNRDAFRKATQQWQDAPDGATLALIMVDLDRFKQVNDTLGHGVGDALLRRVATRLGSATRDTDVVIRLGGDEFVIIHTVGTQPQGALSVGQRIVELMSRTFLVDGHQVDIGASVGIALSRDDVHDPGEILRCADLALYEAKAAGRGAMRVFKPHMAEQAEERRRLEISLRRALALKEFSLYYQPQVTLDDGRTTGFEALIRWHNAERGLVSPGDFIPLAEEIGEIHAIGEWVIHEACHEAVSWPDDLVVAVNVSPLQFQQGNLIETVRQALTQSGLAPQRLELEITESTLMADSHATLRCLRELRRMGVGIAMDDFGTGYSSLSYLNSFPFSKLKLDKNFIQNCQSEKSQALINAILIMGNSLGMTTIAEGIETNDQYRALASSGCISAQGYLISYPMRQDQIASYLANGQFRIIQ